MSLPGPQSGIIWKHYEIDTPTFDLSSIEKPDLSPFLIHLTGRNELLNILQGQNAPEGMEIPNNNGFLKSSIPAFDSLGHYNSSVVCFTESPLFALDFFRYRSFRRWQADQQFGIGFSKSMLVNQCNVRPVIYLDTETNRDLLTFCNRVLGDSIVIREADGTIEDLKPLMQRIKPLLFPLLQNNHSQGFMWEREWRCPDPTGMIFPLETIKVICCSNEEMGEMEELLPNHLDNIQFIQNWKEYDEVTSFLETRGQQVGGPDGIEQLQDIETLNNLKRLTDQTINVLDEYSGVFEQIVSKLKHTDFVDKWNDLRQTSKFISDRIDELEAENPETK